MVSYGMCEEHLPKWSTANCQGKKIATRLGIDGFEGSNGWLTIWKGRYNIKKIRVSRESGDVSGETIRSLKERPPELLRYNTKDIFTQDETGCFWRALPESGFGERGIEAF